MRLGGWMWKQGERDVVLVQEVLLHVAKAKNPFAYFAREGKAIESLRARVATRMAMMSKEQIEREEAAFFGRAR